jgi:hypothetical protein
MEWSSGGGYRVGTYPLDFAWQAWSHLSGIAEGFRRGGAETAVGLDIWERGKRLPAGVDPGGERIFLGVIFKSRLHSAENWE